MATAITGSEDRGHPLAGPAYAGAAVALIIFAASLFGILTRPVGFLAAFWPANAILLGLMVRNPALASTGGWLGAFAGYVAADLVTGNAFGVTIWLTLANMAGAITGYLLFQFLSEGDRQLSRPLSVLYLFAICTTAATVAALTGGGAARILFDRDLATGFEFWFVTELVNSLVILPAILTFPGLRNIGLLPSGGSFGLLDWKAAPIAALILSATAGVAIGGPGAIAFAVPALLWCALTYSMFATAMLTMCFCGWLLVAISSGVVQIHMQDDLLVATSSLRLGVALIALGPLTAASINAARADLLAKLAHAADHDCLTGSLARRAFMERAARLFGDPSRQTRPGAVLMLDLDHFKQVNDRHGHATGDKVLVAFVGIVSSVLRPGDLLGRTGGEEFAIALPGVSAGQALEIAERIRAGFEAASIACEEVRVPVSVSIGVADTTTHPASTLDALLARADQALYRAKAAGRNRVMLADPAAAAA